MGDRVQDTLAAMLRYKGLKAVNEGIAILVANTSPGELRNCLQSLQNEGMPDTYELAKRVANKVREKYDPFLSSELLSADYAATRLDADGAISVLRNMC